MRCSNCGAELSEGTKFCINCGQPVNAAPGVIPTDGPSAVVKQKKGMRPAVTAIVALLIVAVMGGLGFGGVKLWHHFNDEPKQTAGNSETKENEATNGNSEKQQGEQKAESDQTGKFEGVDGANVVDFDNIKGKETFIAYSKDKDFSFVYPKDFFQAADVSTDGDRRTYIFSGSDNITKLKYEVYNNTSSKTAKIKELSAEKDSEIFDDEKRYYPYEDIGKRFKGYHPENPKENDSIHGVVSGILKSNSEIEEYFYCCADGDKIYTMTITTPAVERTINGEESRADYFITCCYLGFSKSNGKRKIVSYEEFRK